MARWSLQTRLLLAAGLWIALAWPLGAWALTNAFTEAIYERLDFKLRALLDTLSDATELAPDGSGLRVADSLAPDFSDAVTGWAWIVEHGDRRISSADVPVLLDVVLPRTDASGLVSFADTTDARGRPLRIAAKQVEGTAGPAILAVVLDSGDVVAERTDFQRLILLSIGLMGIGLVVAVACRCISGWRRCASCDAICPTSKRGRPSGWPDNTRRTSHRSRQP